MTADRPPGPPPRPSRMELVTGAVAAGGGCVARAADGRVVFVRHALPGERVVAEVTVGDLVVPPGRRRRGASRRRPDRVEPPCPHAGPGRCGGCDWQHVALPGPARLEGRAGGRAAPPGGRHRPWRWRSKRWPAPPTDWAGGPGSSSPSTGPGGSGSTATDPTTSSRSSTARWPPPPSTGRGGSARCGGGPPRRGDSVARRGPSRWCRWRPAATGWPAELPVDAGLVVNGRTAPAPDRSRFDGGGRPVRGQRRRLLAGPPGRRPPGPDPSACWTAWPRGAGERVADLYAGAGLFTVPLARAVGPGGSVVAVERSGRACADAGAMPTA